MRRRRSRSSSHSRESSHIRDIPIRRVSTFRHMSGDPPKYSRDFIQRSKEERNNPKREDE